MRPVSLFVPRSSACLVALMLLFVGVFPAAGEAPVIHSGSAPEQGVRRLKLVEKWRAGGDEGGVFFGIITSVTADDVGRVYLLDRQLCQAFIYSADGRSETHGQEDQQAQALAPRTYTGALSKW